MDDRGPDPGKERHEERKEKHEKREGENEEDNEKQPVTKRAKRPEPEAENAIELEGEARVKLRAEAPSGACEVWVRKALLTSDYFQAKFDRWHDESSEPVLTFQLPAGSNAAGLKLVVDRINAEEARAWTCWDWWTHVPDHDVTTLFAALHLLDIVLLESYCREVASMLRRFCIPLPEPYLEIGQKYADKLIPYKPLSLPPIETDSETLALVMKDAVASDDSMKELADRVIAASSSADVAKAMPGIVSTFFCFGVAYSDSWPWLQQYLRQAIRRDPSMADDLVEVILNRVQREEHRTFGSKLVLFILESLFLEACNCSNYCQQDAVHTTIVQLMKIFASKCRDFHPSAVSSMLSLVADQLPELFDAAPARTQIAILQIRVQSEFLRPIVTGRAHKVRPEARIGLLRLTRFLTKEERAFLCKADFPKLAEP